LEFRISKTSSAARWPGRKRVYAAVGLWLAWATLVQAQSRLGNQTFDVSFNDRGVTSLSRHADASDTNYVRAGATLGDLVIRYRLVGGPWQRVATADAAAGGTSEDAAPNKTTFSLRLGDDLGVASSWQLAEDGLVWTFDCGNLGDRPLEIGDLAVPLPIARSSGPAGAQRGPGASGRAVILKHSYIGGHGSFLFWMRSDNAGPSLLLVPCHNTQLEYWDSSRQSGYQVYIHSAAAGETAKERGTKWRQPNTSATLAPRGQPGDSRSYAFRFCWADNYDAVRQMLVDEGGIDVQVVPGMTVPSDLRARLALRTKQPIQAVEAEFPQATRIEPLGGQGETHLYEIRFSKLGENRLTVRYGDERHALLEFFCTEPLETLIAKRAAFLARSQHRDPNKWYNGLITDWNMETQKLLSPDDYAPIPRSRVYAVTCDDPGLGKPAFLAAKNAEFPVQSEVEALDYYIEHFVWGGLQRTTDETYSYAIYGIPNWKVNRDSNHVGRKGQLHLWRIYDYPHVIVMYLSMYRIAKNYPHIRTALPAREYLRRAGGTALAMFTIPHEVWPDWSPYGTGFYNELVIPDLIDELEAASMESEAGALRGHWEKKVKAFVNETQDLFRSEYAFDSTGFESTHALAKYAMQHADKPGETASGIPLENARRFLETQMASNLFCRGCVEPAYYYLGSDYRGGAGNAYTLTYMSQMGGWAVLDYALNFASDPSSYLRLGYASYLSAWALMNTGTPQSNYGYWYPGKANDGGAGGGFEPAPYGMTWLGQPHHRGSWYYACEIDLGYCGALRTAATILADDPIFGRFCFGGDWRPVPGGTEVLPKDGLRRRFHVMEKSRRLHVLLDRDGFAKDRPITVSDAADRLAFELENRAGVEHTTTLSLQGLKPGRYELRVDDAVAAQKETFPAGDLSVPIAMTGTASHRCEIRPLAP
jgi:hypothetical protein